MREDLLYYPAAICACGSNYIFYGSAWICVFKRILDVILDGVCNGIRIDIAAERFPQLVLVYAYHVLEAETLVRLVADGLKGLSAEDVGVFVFPLYLDDVGLGGVFDHVAGQERQVADTRIHRVCRRDFLGAYDAGDLEFFGPVYQILHVSVILRHVLPDVV